MTLRQRWRLVDQVRVRLQGLFQGGDGFGRTEIPDFSPQRISRFENFEKVVLLIQIEFFFLRTLGDGSTRGSRTCLGAKLMNIFGVHRLFGLPNLFPNLGLHRIEHGQHPRLDGFPKTSKQSANPCIFAYTPVSPNVQFFQGTVWPFQRCSILNDSSQATFICFRRIYSKPFLLWMVLCKPLCHYLWG